MLARDKGGNELISIISVAEEKAFEKFSPITHVLAVVIAEDDFIMGYNHFRKAWEVFGGCVEKGESLRQCIERECLEELGLCSGNFKFLGLMELSMAPGFYHDSRKLEYGGLFAVNVNSGFINYAENLRKDKKEIEKLCLYSRIPKTENISPIDKRLFEYCKEKGLCR